MFLYPELNRILFLQTEDRAIEDWFNEADFHLKSVRLEPGTREVSETALAWSMAQLVILQGSTKLVFSAHVTPLTADLLEASTGAVGKLVGFCASAQVLNFCGPSQLLLLASCTVSPHDHKYCINDNCSKAFKPSEPLGTVGYRYTVTSNKVSFIEQRLVFHFVCNDLSSHLVTPLWPLCTTALYSASRLGHLRSAD